MNRPDRPNRPILGFVAGTPLLTPSGRKPIDQLRPGDLIQTRADDKPEAHNEPRWWESN
jgi:hypothetical protein